MRHQRSWQEHDASHFHFHEHEFPVTIQDDIEDMAGSPPQQPQRQLGNKQRLNFLQLAPDKPAGNKFPYFVPR
jgi:hypothetical protein